MRIALIGPSHPYKGGIVQQTTELAHRLAASGHQVRFISWSSQYPQRLYPGSLLPPDQPELPPFDVTEQLLSWKNPLSWRRTGRSLHDCDLVIFVWWFPTLQAPIYSAIRRHLGPVVRTVTLCHNVLPHEPRPADRQLARHFLRSVDRLIVHTSDQAEVARRLIGASTQGINSNGVQIAELPPLLPGWSAARAPHSAASQHHLLFFGIVRPYKGVDVLLRAVAEVPDVSLTIAGEFWDDAASYRQLISELGLDGRVQLVAGYLPADRIPNLFAEADALVLPYQSATGTTNVQLGFGYGVPVIVSDLPVLAEQVHDGSDGLVFERGNHLALAAAIRQLYSGNTLRTLQNSLPAVTVDAAWKAYCQLVSTAGTPLT